MDFSRLVLPEEVLNKQVAPAKMIGVNSSLLHYQTYNYQGCSKCGTERNFRIGNDSATCMFCGHTYNFVKRE